MPKRLLQYALSRLEILDTDALDLENLDIAWGKNSVFEFKDVGLRMRVLYWLSLAQRCSDANNDMLTETRDPSPSASLTRDSESTSASSTAHNTG
jgi:hypothetical protein